MRKQKEKEKERLKVLKEEERAKKKEEKARRKAEKESHSKDAAAVGADDTRAGAMSPELVATEQESPPQGSHGNGIIRRATPPIPLKTSETEPKEHTQSPGKVKNWLRAKLTRKPRDEPEQPRSFIGGHVLRSPEPSTGSNIPAPSARDVDSLARRIRHPHLEEERARTPSLSGREGERSETGRRVSSGTEDMFEDARDGLSPPMTPPRMVGAVASGSPNRDSRFVEMMD